MTYEEYIELRDKAKVTNYRVAKDLTMGNSYFYKWRKGLINPKESTLERITKYLKNTPRGK